jgi:hypothetical protein
MRLVNILFRILIKITAKEKVWQIFARVRDEKEILNIPALAKKGLENDLCL